MGAAAAVGGVLAVVVPTAAATASSSSDLTADEATVLRLATAEGSPDPDVAAGGMRLLASVVPVTEVGEPEPPELDVSELLKAAGLADVARKAAEQQAAREAAAHCETGLGGLGGVKPWVRAAAQMLSCLYDEPTLIGVAQRSRHSDHPSGHAIDLMASKDQGDRIAECALRNQEELGITYVIWRQRVNYGNGWEHMSDRGGATANHYDHVHISFAKNAPGGQPSAGLCT